MLSSLFDLGSLGSEHFTLFSAYFFTEKMTLFRLVSAFESVTASPRLVITGRLFIGSYTLLAMNISFELSMICSISFMGAVSIPVS